MLCIHVRVFYAQTNGAPVKSTSDASDAGAPTLSASSSGTLESKSAAAAAAAAAPPTTPTSAPSASDAGGSLKKEKTGLFGKKK